MDDPNRLDGDVDHMLKSCGISGFEYRSFGVAAARLPKSSTEYADTYQFEEQQKTNTEESKANSEKFLSNSNAVMLSYMFKTLSLD